MDQICTPLLLEEARYMPFGEIVSAVIAPIEATSEKVLDFAHVLRDMVIISSRIDLHVSSGHAADAVPAKTNSPCARVATTKYSPEGCQIAEQSCANSSGLHE